MLFTKDDTSIVGELQQTPNNDGFGTTRDRWYFTLPLIDTVSMKTLFFPDDTEMHYYADTDEERDVLAEKLLDLIIDTRSLKA